MERITSENTNRALPNRNADKTTVFVQKQLCLVEDTAVNPKYSSYLQEPGEKLS